MSRQDITGSQIVEAIRTHCGVSLQEAGAALRAYAEPKQHDRAAFHDRAFLAAITGLCAAPDRPREVAEEALRIAVQATTLRESFK
ncbi:hypothetical protein [Klebsiella aerogenes]|uniref:hypothetical protein n=1 Tax=Klebsiella aerogenes TaxID=548 RepID=UPI0037B39B92